MKRIRRFYKGGNWTYMQYRRAWKQEKKNMFRHKHSGKCLRFKVWAKGFTDYLKSLNDGNDYTE